MGYLNVRASSSTGRMVFTPLVRVYAENPHLNRFLVIFFLDIHVMVAANGLLLSVYVPLRPVNPTSHRLSYALFAYSRLETHVPFR